MDDGTCGLDIDVRRDILIPHAFPYNYPVTRRIATQERSLDAGQKRRSPPIAFAGNLQGTTQTLPLLIYLESQNDLDAAVALSLVLVVVAVLVIVATRTRDAAGLRS